MVARGALDEAEAACRAALARDPGLVVAHGNLGWVLLERGALDASVEASRAALARDPGLAWVHNNLGVALREKGDLDGAIAAYHKAIKLKPDYPEAHNGLGIALENKGDYDAAIAEYREALRLDPKEALYHGNLGKALRCKGFEGRLPAVIRGEDLPADADERVAFALMCYCKGLCGASARLYAEAFAAQPELAENMDAGHRYNAACAAALAGSGRGRDDPPLDEEDRTRWRKRALDWLRADLEVWEPRAASPNRSTRDSVIQTLQHWLSDPDLAGPRDKDALEKLPEEERDKWHTLWAEVKALLDQVKRS